MEKTFIYSPNESGPAILENEKINIHINIDGY